MVWDKPPEDPGLSDLDRTIIGKSKRLTLPLHDKMLLREVADLLRGLANAMDFESRRENITEREALINMSYEMDCTNRKIRFAAQKYGCIIREGRPPDSQRREQKANGHGTL